MKWKDSLPLRVAGPTILVSLLLLGLCILAALYLYAQQAESAAALTENVSSTQVAHNLENTLSDLIELLRANSKDVVHLHRRVTEQLAEARHLADKDEEQRLLGQLEDAWTHYFEL